MSKTHILKLEVVEVGKEPPMDGLKSDKEVIHLRDYKEGRDLLDLIRTLSIIDPELRKSIPEYIRWMQKIRNFIENP